MKAIKFHNGIRNVVRMCLLTITFLVLADGKSVKAQINEETAEDMTAKIAYLDLSSVSPMELHFTEDDSNRKPDYYYAAYAFNILKEKAAMDSMYSNCNEVIVTIDRAYSTSEVIVTSCEPQAETGYLRLLSKDANKYYTIDNVIIHIQREK